MNDRQKVYFDLCYLVSCTLHAKVPDIEGMDMAAVFNLAARHNCVVLAASALGEVADKVEPRLYDAIKRRAVESVYRLNLLDAERAELLAYLNERAIWHMPLKGVVLSGLYPQYGTREMCDNDILYDQTRQAEVADFFCSREYSCELDGGSHDIFIKPPVYNFEMHRVLFETVYDSKWVQYYSNVKDRLVKDDVGCGYHFTDEDFYIYLMLHYYKHFSRGGTGMRSLVDSYVYLRAKDSLDLGYVEREEEKLGIIDYGRRVRALSQRLFESAEREILLDDDGMNLFEYVMSSGTYGTVEHLIENRAAAAGGKWGYIRMRLFPGLAWYENYAPFFYKYKVLIPFFWLYRLFRGVFFKPRRIKKEIETINK